MKIPAIICDIDGTIADISHRLHFIQGEEKDWDNFYANCENDLPKQDIIDLVRDLAKKHDAKIIFITGRSKDILRKTMEWILEYALKNNSTTFVSTGKILMRESGDHRQDYIIKKELYDEYIKDKYDVKYVFEDRDQVVKMYRELGLTVLQVADGNF